MAQGTDVLVVGMMEATEMSVHRHQDLPTATSKDVRSHAEGTIHDHVRGLKTAQGNQ